MMTGSDYNCIRDAAEEQSADVVIAARPSRGQTEAQFLRVRAILRGLPCPLVSVSNRLASSRSVIDGARDGASSDGITIIVQRHSNNPWKGLLCSTLH